MRILALTRYSSLGASSRIRFYQYFPYLTSCKNDLHVMPLLGDDYIIALYNGQRKSMLSIGISYFQRLIKYINAGSYDLLWIEKELFPWLPAWAESFLSVRGIPFVVDFDDAVFHRYDIHRNQIIRTLLGEKINTIMRHATTVVVGNDYLADHAIRAGAGKIVYLPSVVDVDRYSINKMKNKQFRIGWIGSPVTALFLGLIKDALVDVCKKTGACVVLIGSGERDPLPGLEKDTFPWSENSEVEILQGCDVGIMPLPDEPFTRGKCGYKLIQYMASGLPVIASPVGENVRIIEQGKTGFLASGKEEWVHALIELYHDTEMRRNMGMAGRQRVEKYFSLQITAPRLVDILTEAVLRSGKM
jgi:glycosyltransferase involved in cell wall biosynthesis